MVSDSYSIAITANPLKITKKKKERYRYRQTNGERKRREGEGRREKREKESPPPFPSQWRKGPQERKEGERGGHQMNPQERRTAAHCAVPSQ